MTGGEMSALAGLMGHSTVRTLSRYVSNTYEHYVKAMVELEERLDGILKTESSSPPEEQLGDVKRKARRSRRRRKGASRELVD